MSRRAASTGALATSAARTRSSPAIPMAWSSQATVCGIGPAASPPILTKSGWFTWEGQRAQMGRPVSAFSRSSDLHETFGFESKQSRELERLFFAALQLRDGLNLARAFRRGRDVDEQV